MKPYSVKIIVSALLSLHFSLFALSAQTYIITNIAGLRTAGYSGDGGVATDAQLYNPMGVCLDNNGNIYISDWGNSRLRKINNNGIITTIAGKGIFGYSGDGGAATLAELNGPMSVFADATGNIYIADIGNSRIRMINTGGVISTIAGNGAYGFSGDGGLAINAELSDPIGVCSDIKGNIYLADVFNNRVRKIDTLGIISTIAGCGVRGYSGDGGSATNAELYYPAGLAADDYGNIFIADEDNNCIRKVNSTGIISTIAGNGVAGFSGDGGAASLAELSNSTGITLDKTGNIYIADGFNNRIRMINTGGIISTIAGNGIPGYSGVGVTATLASLYNPVSISSDESGNLYFANAFNNFVQKLTKDSVEKLPPSISVFPNPNYGTFNVNIGNFAVVLKFEMFNIIGQQMSVTGLNTSLTEINMGGVSKGIYLYRVMESNNVVLATGKLVVL